MCEAAPEITKERAVVVVGAGGNIGSHLINHLARIDEVREVILIDHDTYEAKNLASQDIRREDVGKAKVWVQAQKMSEINPGRRCLAIQEDVEFLPLGRLRSDLIISCLDSRRVRQYVNQAAWHLGVPLVDTAVEAGGLLARVNVYVPGIDNPCLECAWDNPDYQLLEQGYPCTDGRPQPAPTNAPSSLGALAASLAAIESWKLLVGGENRAAVSKQVLVDALHHKHYVTRFLLNQSCLFDHEIWRIHTLSQSAGDLTLRQAFALGSEVPVAGSTRLSVDGKPFVRRLLCPCGNVRPILRLLTSAEAVTQNCDRCGQRMVAAGFDVTGHLESTQLSDDELARTLLDVGIRPREILTLSSLSGETRFEIGGDQR